MTKQHPDRPPPEGGAMVYAAILALFLVAAIAISLLMREMMDYVIHCYKEFYR